MRISSLAWLIVLASCAPSPKEGFVVVDPWGSVVLRTEDEEKAWRLANELTRMGRVLASRPEYFVLKAVSDER